MTQRKVIDEFPPRWSADAIWYQIFPERFRCGCQASNPVVDDFSDKPVEDWEITQWGKDWYSLDDWEKKAGDFSKSVYSRRYGGDLLGVRDKLDYLQQLGITAIYLNPVFWAPSLHKYDGSSYHHIDPAFGPDRQGDLEKLEEAGETEDPATWIWTEADKYFLDLVKDIHDRGMKIIIDGVFNHTGTRFFAFRDLMKNKQHSVYRKWYRHVRWDKQGRLHYKGWFGHSGLPELGRRNDNLVEPVREYIFNSTRRWMEPYGPGSSGDGIDGWRLDVAFCVPHGFWRDWRHLVKTINPSAFLCGEIVKLATPYLHGDELDAVMNYMWTYPVMSFFAPAQKPMPASSLRRRLDKIFHAYPADVCHGLQNLLDSHDVGRVLTMLENPDKPKSSWDDYFNATRTGAHTDLITTRPGSKSYEILRQLVVFQMTFPGAPMIYYGTEVGMWGANDPDNRQPMLWSDIAYEAESHTLTGPCRKTPRAPDMDLFRFYQKAICLRKSDPAFSRGKFKWEKLVRGRLLGYIRYDDQSEILILLNASDRNKYFNLSSPALDLWQNGQELEPGRLRIEPRGWRIVRLK